MLTRPVLVTLLLPLFLTAAACDDPADPPEICDNGEDDDGDGDADCADSACASAPACDVALTARDDEASATEDTALEIPAADLLQNDLGAGGLEVTAVESAVNGTVELSGSTITFTPAADFSGAASFRYTIEAGGETSSATVRLTVSAVDDPPVAADDAAAMREDTVRVFGGADLLGNDVDVDTEVLVVTAVDGAVNGTAVLAGGNVTFTPPADFTGTSSFGYTVSDGTSTDTATVTITVIGEDDPPIVVDDEATTAEDTALEIDAATLLGNDSDPDGTLAVESVQGAVNGAVSLAGTTITFVPAADFAGTASFTYTAGDGSSSATATVTVTVTPVDDPPVAGDDAAGTDEDVPLTIPMATLLGNDVDVDDVETITSVQDAINGSVAIAGSDVVFTPEPEFFGTASFTYTLTGGALTDTGLVTVTVAPVEDCLDGAPDAGEECDDGNATPGDGCENDCTFTCASGSGADDVAVHAGNCYAWFDGDTLDWQGAETFCEGLGGYLPVVADAAEHAFLQILAASGDPWLGASDVGAEGTFVWVNGDAFTFQPWAGGQPDNGSGANEEDCVHLWNDAGGGWNDSNCPFVGFVTGVACEIEPVSCGDGVVQAAVGETCDDDNTIGDDGCSATCQLEPRLVINEVDYDNIGTDTAEFIEIYNAGAGPAVLADFAVVVVNGASTSNAQYDRWDLSESGVATLAPGEYLLIANASVVSPPVARIAVGTDSVQNGAPDAIGLFRISDGSLRDALSYEGQVTAGVSDFGTHSYVEGTPTALPDSNTVAGSLSRSPNGTDSNNALTDWIFATTPTPGASN